MSEDSGHRAGDAPSPSLSSADFSPQSANQVADFNRQRRECRHYAPGTGRYEHDHFCALHGRSNERCRYLTCPGIQRDAKA